MLYIAIIIIVAGVTLLGFVSNLFETKEWVNDHEKINEFQSWLIAYGNGGCESREIMGKMLSSSTKVEAALGVDNYVSGVVAFHTRLMGVPVIPFVIREIDQKAGDYLWRQDIQKALYLIDSVLIRRMGRIRDFLDDLKSQRKNPFVLFVRGWKYLWAIPLYLLSSFGLLGNRTVRSARESKPFQVITFLTLVATVLGCVFAYLPNRSLIDKELGDFLIE